MTVDEGPGRDGRTSRNWIQSRRRLPYLSGVPRVAEEEGDRRSSLELGIVQKQFVNVSLATELGSLVIGVVVQFSDGPHLLE